MKPDFRVISEGGPSLSFFLYKILKLQLSKNFNSFLARFSVVLSKNNEMKDKSLHSKKNFKQSFC